MHSGTSAALETVKSSADLSGRSCEGIGGGPPRFQRKTARISELLQDGTVKEKLGDFDPSLTHKTNGNGSYRESVTAGSLYNGSGSVHESVHDSMPGGAMSGRNKWRKLNKAVVATKVLASRPNALGASRQRTLQSLQQQKEASPPTPTSLDAGTRVRVWTLLTGTLRNALARMVILPETRWYQVWWFYYAVAIAILSCWVEPFQMAFQSSGPPSGIWMTMLEYVIITTFLFDFIFKFFIAYYDTDTGLLVTSQPAMTLAYVKSFKFFLDVLGCFPYDLLVSAITRSQGVSPAVTESLDWLKLLALSRAYRVFDLFHVLDYRMMLSQGTLMLLRNYIYVFFTAHWAACIFFHVAQEERRFGDESWVGRNADDFIGRPIFEQYIMSLYFSVTVFTAMGDAKLFPYSLVEIALTILYLLFNLFLAAYIIGTVTIMMVRADEHSKAFRESVSHLHEYSRENELPDRLYKAMKEHLEVHFDSAQTTDDQVLGIYPTTIRRRALRHLYLQPVKGCYLFKGCKQRFLDAVLTAARVELFLPGVEILTEGDNVVELLIIVVGEVAVSQGAQRAGGGLYGNNSMAAGSEMMSFSQSHGGHSFSQSFVDTAGDQSMSILDGDTSTTKNGAEATTPLVSPGSINFAVQGSSGRGRGNAHTMRGCSDAMAEIAFFTDGASYETVVGTTPVRVLSLHKTAWELLVHQFPQQAKLVLENVQRAAEAAVEENLKAAGGRSQLTESQLHVALSLVNGTGGFGDSTDPMLLAQTRDALTHNQMEMITRLDDVRTVASAHVRKCDEMRTFEFLNTAAQGDVESLRTMLDQGISPNTADYDGRTGLMLSAAKGHDDTVRLLLDKGANKDKTDAFGISALAEAAKNANDSTIELMLSYGATLGAGGLAVAAEMCTAVFEGDLVKLRRLLHAGAPPDASDYDKRSALHIAGAEGNLAAVKLLIEEGGADPNFQDRWGNTALDEARRMGATLVISYLEGRQQRDASVTAEKKRQQAAHEFMSWCNLGEVADLRAAGGYSHGDEAGCAFSGLLVAACKGHKDVIEVLLEGMPSSIAQNHAHVAMLEAARMGHPDTVASFRVAGVALRDQHGAGMRYLAADIRNAAQQGNGAVLGALLAAGVSGRRHPGDGSSPLHMATEHSHLGVVRRLVEHGGAHVDLATVDGLGKTPLELSVAVLKHHPHDSRARSVHEYLAWVTPLAAGGATTQQVEAAAVERWGAIGQSHSGHDMDGAQHMIPPPGGLMSPMDGIKGPVGGIMSPMADIKSPMADIKGPMADIKSGMMSPISGERLLLSLGSNTSRDSMSRSNSIVQPTGASRSTATPPHLGTVQEEVMLARKDSTLVKAAPVRAVSNISGVQGMMPSGTAVAEEVWENLPGTPGGSSRGGTRAAHALKQFETTVNAVDAAMFLNATAMHSAALLNEPPGSAAAAAAGSSAGCLSPIARSGTGIGSSMPGGSAAAAGSGLGSPCLILPPNAGRLLSSPASPSMARSYSNLGAASRLFGPGAAAPAGGAADGAGTPRGGYDFVGTGSGGSVGGSRALNSPGGANTPSRSWRPAIVQSVAEDEIEECMGGLGGGAKEGGVEGGDRAGSGSVTGMRAGLSSGQHSPASRGRRGSRGGFGGTLAGGSRASSVSSPATLNGAGLEGTSDAALLSPQRAQQQ